MLSRQIGSDGTGHVAVQTLSASTTATPAMTASMVNQGPIRPVAAFSPVAAARKRERRHYHGNLHLLDAIRVQRRRCRPLATEVTEDTWCSYRTQRRCMKMPRTYHPVRLGGGRHPLSRDRHP
jgi:hypothetical protein